MRVIIVIIIFIFLSQNIAYSLSEHFVKVNLRKPLDFNDRQSSLKYAQALKEFELSRKNFKYQDAVLKEEVRKGRLKADDIAAALKYYSEEELSDFFSRLNRFEEHLYRLIGDYIGIEAVNIRVGMQGLGAAGLGVRPNIKTLFIDPVLHRDLLKEADYDLAHEYAHILLNSKDYVYRSLPEEIKRGSVSEIIFGALLNSAGFNHPIFGKIQLGAGVSNVMLWEFGGEDLGDLLDSVMELMAIRASHLITNDMDSLGKQEYQILVRRVESFKKLDAWQIQERRATLAADIVWTKMLGYEELTYSLIKLTEGWPEEKLAHFNSLVEKMTYLWDCFSLNKPITADLKDVLKSTDAVSNNL